MAITKTDGKTKIGRQHIPEKLKVYYKETGEAYEKFPIDAHECVASGAYSFEKGKAEAEEEGEVTTDESQESVEEANGEADAETEEGQEEVDYSTWKKADLIELARNQGKAANNTMSKDKLIEIVSAEG